MQELDVAAILHGGMLATLKICTPLLLAPLAAGLAIAVLQAVTQISDSTISFLPKLVATGAAAWITGPFLFHVAADYMHEVADKIVAIGGQ
jgi:flagellar biosynthetic protein FliQ